MAGDGSFSAVVAISPTGTSLFVAEATDTDGHVGRVTQALSAGPRRRTSAALPDSIDLSLSDAVFALLGAASGEILTGDELALRLAPLNPIIDSGAGCLRAAVSLGGIDMDGAAVELRPTATGVQLIAEWNGVTVPLHVAYTAVCVDGVADVAMTAERVRITGVLDVSARDGRIETVLRDPQVQFDGFQLSLPGLPPVILPLLHLEEALGPVLGLAMQLLEQPLLGELLGGLAGSTTLPVAGALVDSALTVSGVAMAPSEAKIRHEALFRARGAPSVDFVSLPNAAPVLAGLGDVVVGVADDAVSSLAAGVWGATGGALQVTLPDELADVFDDISASQLLPVSVHADGSVHLVIPDVMIHLDRDDGVSADLAVTGAVAVHVEQDAGGHLHLAAGTPVLDVDVASSQRPLTRSQLTAITDMVIDSVQDLVNQILGALPLPALAGAPLTNLSAVGRAGTILVSGRVP